MLQFPWSSQLHHRVPRCAGAQRGQGLPTVTQQRRSQWAGTPGVCRGRSRGWAHVSCDRGPAGECWPHGTWYGREVQVGTWSLSFLLLPLPPGSQRDLPQLRDLETSGSPIALPPVPPASSPCTRLPLASLLPQGVPYTWNSYQAPSLSPLSGLPVNVPSPTPQLGSLTHLLSFPDLLTPLVIIPPCPLVSRLSAPRGPERQEGSCFLNRRPYECGLSAWAQERPHV